MDRLKPAKTYLKNQAWTPQASKALWGSYYGKELEFFIKCADAIESHKSELWEIANSQPILEADVFDERSVALAPKALQKQAKEELTPVGSETVSPKTLYLETLRRYDQMWLIPGRPLMLSPLVTFSLNTKSDAISRYHKTSHVITKFTSAQKTQTLERYFEDESTVKALSLFTTPTHVEMPLLETIKSLTIQDPTGFVAEWTAKNILKKQPPL
jgi:hypothetical protein